MPTAVTKTVESSEEDSDDESKSLDVEIDSVEGVERGSATETDDSNDESDDSDSDVDSVDEGAESGGADPDNSANKKGSASSSAQSSAAKRNAWSGMFEEAKNFVASHGTMLVPFNHRLFPWLKEQAALYRRGLAGEKKLLTKEQKERLKILGMDDFLENPVHRLRDVHVELVWLGERSRDKETGQATLFDWEFIRCNASKALAAEMTEKETFGKRKNTKLPSLVGRGNQTRFAFDELKEEVRAALDSGVELKLPARKYNSSAADPPSESSGEESSEDEAMNARAYDSDDSSSVNLDEMAKNAAVDDNDSSSDSDSDDHVSDNGMKVVSDVPDDKWSLTPMEEEVAWLGEESMVATKNKTFDWTFIRTHASSELKQMIEEKELFTKHKHQKLQYCCPRIQNKKVKRNFESKREQIRKKLASGYRRKQTKKVLSSSTNETDDEMNDGLGTVGLNLWQDTTMPTLELTAAEEDLAWLLEEQAHYGKNVGGVDWDYVLAHASPELKIVIEAKKVREAKKSEKFDLLLRSTPGIKEAFEMKRGDIRKKLADGYRRASAATPSKKAAPSPKTPTSRSKKSLNDFEMEVAHLVEESMFHSDSGRTDWVFIEDHASTELLEHMKAREIFTKFKNKKLPKLVRLHDELVAKAFQERRLEIRESLIEGVRREETKEILPEKPGKRWQQIFKDSSELVAGKKRTAAEAGLGDDNSDEGQQLTGMQKELCWLMQESQFAKGISKTDWSFVEKHASKRLKMLMQEKKERDVKYRTVYAYFNIQANPRLKRAYEGKCNEVRGLLESGHRRKGMGDFLPDPGEEGDSHGGGRTPGSFGKAGAGGKRKKRRSKAKAEIITDGFLDSTQVSPAEGYEGGRMVSVRQSVDYHPSRGNEWGEATLHTFIDIKKSDGGYSRQYKVRLKDGSFGWLGQDHVKSQDETNGTAGSRQGEQKLQSQGDGAEAYGVYQSVFTSMFPSESPASALPESSKEDARQPPKKKTPREELTDLIGELRFQRENYRQEMRRQQDRFEAHTSLMERLEQKAMDIVMKEDANRSEGGADAESEKGGDSSQKSEGAVGGELEKAGGTSNEIETPEAADEETEKVGIAAKRSEAIEDDVEMESVGDKMNGGKEGVVHVDMDHEGRQL